VVFPTSTGAEIQVSDRALVDEITRRFFAAHPSE
jgi:hypothetical protein